MSLFRAPRRTLQDFCILGGKVAEPTASLVHPIWATAIDDMEIPGARVAIGAADLAIYSDGPIVPAAAAACPELAALDVFTHRPAALPVLG